MSYAAILVTLLIAVLGVLFGKSGEGGKARIVRWLVVALLLISGLISVYLEHNKQLASESLRSQLSQSQETLEQSQKKVTDLQAKLAEISERDILSKLKLDEPITIGNLTFSWPYGSGDESGEDQPLSKLFFGSLLWPSHEGVFAKVSIYIDDVISSEYSFSRLQGDVLQVAQAGDEDRTMFTSRDMIGCFSPTPVGITCTDQPEPKHGHWFSDFVAGATSDGVTLAPEDSTQKVISRAMASVDVASMTLLGVSEGDHQLLKEAVEKKELVAELKFYISVQNDGDENCDKTLNFALKPEVTRVGSDTAIQFRNVGDVSLSYCENSPIN